MIGKYLFRLKKDGTPCSNCYCITPELIENYDKAIADEKNLWQCHHRLETHNSDGERRLVNISSEELKVLDMYYDRPPEELIFLTSAEHNSLHRKGRHHSVSEETKRKISEAKKGKHRTEETRKKQSEAIKGKHWKLVDGKRVWY